MSYIVTFFVVFSITILMIHFYLLSEDYISQKAIEIYINTVFVSFVLISKINDISIEEIVKDIRSEINLFREEMKIAIHDIIMVEDEPSLGDMLLMKLLELNVDYEKINRKSFIKDLEVREKSLTFVMS